ncbi:MAG TPA: hypothetical protein P5119_03590 [Candidatus Aminicenantes bacterium]|nr:hypothetical protein [Candidatus Aminicenantes bacterium]HRY64406.1 hypothetical protein [Candidatus Aminicenantes bacterium]HRZ71319.1 hypothetical protein [Candidatus Aminicenantes bacterium]
MSELKRTTLFAILLVLPFCASHGRADENNDPPIDVSLIDLRESGNQYDNRLVRVHGEYFCNFEESLIVLRDPKTDNIVVSIWVDLHDDVENVKENRDINALDFMRLAMSGKLKDSLNEIHWIVPLPIKPLPDSQLSEMLEYRKAKSPGRAKITVIGGFDYANKGRLILLGKGEPIFMGGYGHQASWQSRIVAESIVIQKD